jgi:glycosyltransferase involved in cell wall biosynthesis
MKRRIRIVHILADVEPGGAEHQVLVFLKQLDRRYWDPSVVCTHGGGDMEPEFRATGVPFEIIGRKHRFDFGMILRLICALKRLNPDIVHTSLFSSNFYGRIAALMLPRKPAVVASEHSIDSTKNFLHRFADRVLTRRSDQVYAVSSAVRDFYVNKVGLPDDRTKVIWCGINLDRALAASSMPYEERLEHRRSLGIPDDAFVLGYVGKPTVEKRLDLLAEVLGRVAAEGMPVWLLQLGRGAFPGDEHFQEKFEEMLEQYNVTDRVVYRGYITDVSRDYAIMDALVQTSDSEGLPNALIEAQVMEVPVVATSAGGTKDIVQHRETGWLVDTGDTDGLVEGLLHVWKHPDEVRAWRVAGRARSEELFSEQAVVDKLTRLYRRLLEDRGFRLPPTM